MTAFREDLITERLVLRRLSENDYENIASILQDPEVMYAYEHAFSKSEVKAWLETQLRRYKEEDGLGLLAVLLKPELTFIGQCGLTRQSIGERIVIEVGYLFGKDYWHHGYATEAANAVKNYAFDVLCLDEVWAIIRENNFSSQNVALRLGMKRVKTIDKFYYGIHMPHICYCIKKDEGA